MFKMTMNFELPAISDTRKLRSPYEGNSAAGAVICSKVPWVLMNPSNNRPIMLRYFKAFSSYTFSALLALFSSEASLTSTYN
ncbi:hypothetical protein Tco_0304117 [Tanacetum coccineum]